MLVTADHAVTISFDGKVAVATPNDLSDMGNGDTLQINGSGGLFRVVFTPWPFAEASSPGREVTTNSTFTFKNQEPFTLSFDFDCFITAAGSSAEYGYGTSGGRGSVRPPGK